MKAFLLAILIALVVPAAALAEANGTVIGGGGGSVTGMANPATADLDMNGNAITDASSISTSSGTDGQREITGGANTTYDCATRAPSSGQVKWIAEGGVAKVCDSSGNEVVVEGAGRVLLDSDLNASAATDLRLEFDDWQTVYDQIVVELIDVYCTIDGGGVRIRYDDNGTETAGDAYVGKTFHDSGTATETLVEGAALRTDTTELINTGSGFGVTGTIRIVSNGTAATSAFSMFVDWIYSDSVNEAIVAQTLYVKSPGLTSFDGFFIDCASADTINGSVKMIGLANAL